MEDFFEEEQNLSKEAELNKKDNLTKAYNSFNRKLKPIIEKNTLENEQLNNEEKIDNEKEVYISQKGFVEVPIIRGWFEILPLINIIKDNNLNSFIMGGYVRYMASKVRNPIPAGDVDIYSKTDESFNKFVDILKNKYNLTIKHENSVSMTFKNIEDHEHTLFSCPTIQLIKPVAKGAIVATGTMEEILENFDFTVIRCGVKLYDPPTALVDADFEHDEEIKCLRIKNIHCPISSTLRIVKYAKKGYWIPPMHVLPLFLDWERRDEEYRRKLVDFLKKANKGQGLTQEQVNELEDLLMVD